jgi:hypothetical protein
VPLVEPVDQVRDGHRLGPLLPRLRTATRVDVGEFTITWTNGKKTVIEITEIATVALAHSDRSVTRGRVQSPANP